MRVLARSFAVLEALAAKPGSHLDELAEAVDLPRATCARLLTALDHLGWVSHHGDRGGWQLGPRAQVFAESAPFHSRLLAIARPHLTTAARALQQPVVLSVLHGMRRLVIERIWPHGFRDRHIVDDGGADLISTAPGRLLLAMQPAATRRRLCERLGLPDQRRWPGCVDLGEMLGELARLARHGELESQTPSHAAMMVAAPDGNGGWAVIHTFAPLPGHARARMVLRQVAERISSHVTATRVRLPHDHAEAPKGDAIRPAKRRTP